MLGVENYIHSRESRDMMSMPGSGYMPMGGLPPNYPMPRPDQMYQGMVPSWPGQGYPTGPGGYGDPHGDMVSQGPPDTCGMPNNKYDPPPVSPPPQRERFSYTRYQIELLNGIYEGIRYPNSMQKQLIAKRVGITRDQVKIWFQNRRRKDVIGKHNPAKAPPPEEPNKPRMVPEQVMKGVVIELIKYENDPKGKKIKEAIAKSERSVQAHKRQKTGNSSPDSDGPKMSPEVSYDDLIRIPSPKYQPQGNFALVDNYGMTQPLFPNPSMAGSVERNSASPKSHLDSFSSSSFSADSPQSSLNSPQEVEATHGPSPPSAIPSSEQLDMVAPPNVIIPQHVPNPLKRARSEDSLSDLSASIENISPPALKIERECSPPPNKVAPPSEPIRFSVNSAFIPTKPLSVSIPTSDEKSPPANVQASQSEMTYAAMANMHMGWHMPMPDYQYGREQQPYGNHGDDQSTVSGQGMHQYGNNMTAPSSDGKSLNINGVFPFPLVSDTPRIMASMASYPEHYAHAQTMTAGGYQPLMISSFNNPYYGYDTSGWPGFQDKQQSMTKN